MKSLLVRVPGRTIRTVLELLQLRSSDRSHRAHRERPEGDIKRNDPREPKLQGDTKYESNKMDKTVGNNDGAPTRRVEKTYSMGELETDTKERRTFQASD